MLKRVLVMLWCSLFALVGLVAVASANYPDALVKECEKLKADAKDKKDMPASIPGVKEIKGDEVKKMLDEKKKIVIMDNRLKADFDKEHINGAVLLTVDDLIKDPKLADKYNKNDTLINY